MLMFSKLLSYKSTWLLFLVIALVVIVIGVQNRSFAPQEVVERANGALYMSLAKEGEPLSILRKKVGTTDAISEIISLDGASVLQFESTSLNKSFFVFSPIAENAKGVRTSNIMLVDGTTKTRSMVLPDTVQLSGIKSLDYSEENDLLAFSAQEQTDAITSAKPVSADSFNVYTVNLETQEVTKISTGIDPVWSPDGSSLIFLDADGIQQYVQATKKVTPVQLPFSSTKTSVGTNMNIDVAPNGSQLVLSSPNDKALFFFAITSWEPVKLEMYRTYTGEVSAAHRFYWPTFSFDSNFLAVQQTDVASDGTDENPRVTVIDLSDLTLVHEFSLEGYDFTRAFIDDWQIQ